jgi:hypothetical protein
MKNTLKFRSHLTLGGEILAQSATFLPVKTGRWPASGEICPPETLDLAGFLPVLTFNRKNLTVAQPLLKGGLR